MKLLAKFNLIVILIFGIGWGITEIYAYRSLMRAARLEVVRQAELMMEAASATRNYTSKDIKPLLDSGSSPDAEFRPETVPAFGATSVFQYLRKGDYSQYTYREPSLDPTNPANRALDWEADIINTFRNYKGMDRIIGERDTPAGRLLYVARPLRAEESCMECHSTAARAPVAMIRRYGPSNGFGWRLGEVMAARVISVPMAVPSAEARQTFTGLSVALGLVFLCAVALLNWALYVFVLRPVREGKVLTSGSAGDLAAGARNWRVSQISG
jgi:protein-histidine pros-kinase